MSYINSNNSSYSEGKKAATATHRSFTVQFSSRSAQRKVLASWAKGRAGSKMNSSGEATIPPQSSQQQLAATDQAQRLHQANLKDYEAAVRQPRDDAQYLKRLVCAGLLFQRQNRGLDKLVDKICGSSKQAVKASAPGTCTVVTPSQAEDLNFVARTMCLDIEYLLSDWGYVRTLKALMEMNMWRL